METMIIKKVDTAELEQKVKIPDVGKSVLNIYLLFPTIKDLVYILDGELKIQ